MRRAILIIMLISLTVFTYGCSGINIFTNSSAARSKILRETKLGTNYQVYQLEITLVAGGELPIILELADGSKVDGFFYVEKGDNSIAFSITGTSAMYKSDFKALPTDTPVSDRFSFSASTAQGTSYILKLSNTSNAASKTKSTIYFEVIYQGPNPIFTPLTK